MSSAELAVRWDYKYFSYSDFRKHLQTFSNFHVIVKWGVKL